MEVLSTDKAFTTSPQNGDPECICSRCGRQVTLEEVCGRLYPEDDDEPSDCIGGKGWQLPIREGTEYRYCEQCLVSAGVDIDVLTEAFEDDYEPDRKCRVCGCHEYDACIHPKHGPCWWVEWDLCSHCSSWPGESKRYSQLENES